MQVRGVEVLAVLEALERAPALVSDLVQELRMPASDVKAILEALRKKGVVDRAESGFYYIRRADNGQD
ncbi:MAG: ArsR family transcriptional regulator [Thermococcus sp.]|uniref:MarR family transcriptional regulator n=1 Tax=Thermococcus sp. TaxID=35749 RepID=UPI001DBF5F84|nr:MarR family transcriptional regulator [Thermococcus sp.]MBO8175217.1 ArsR family transcriptional regulator [Thermococcus sp.]